MNTPAHSLLNKAILGLSVLVFACASTNDPAPNGGNNTTPPEPYKPPVYGFEKTPTWSDEFDYQGLPDEKKWGYDVGGNGWGNNERQYYSDKRTQNARVENGKLTIEAIKERFQGSEYTSARLVTKNKGDWKYGRFEIRAKLPKGTGTWPAIWMLPTKQSYSNVFWPDNGEIDIMEHVGFDQGRVHATIHTNLNNHMIGTQKSGTMMVTDCSENFYDYALEWTPNGIKAFINGKEYFDFPSQSSTNWRYWPFDQPFHLILNIAVGGNWGGQKGIDDSIFPQKLEVEYVRVYKMTTQ
jgi:beta-glucanase (GH16 family)